MYENPLGNETRLKSVLEWRSLLKQTNKQDKIKVIFRYLLSLKEVLYFRKPYQTKLDVHKVHKVCTYKQPYILHYTVQTTGKIE